MYLWCHAFSIYSGNEDHFEGTYHLYSNIFDIKMQGHFYKHILPKSHFSYSYFHRIKKLYALVCVLVPHKQLPPQNNVTGISLLDISSRSLSQFYLTFFSWVLKTWCLQSQYNVAYYLTVFHHHYSSLSSVNFLDY